MAECYDCMDSVIKIVEILDTISASNSWNEVTGLTVDLINLLGYAKKCARPHDFPSKEVYDSIYKIIEAIANDDFKKLKEMTELAKSQLIYTAPEGIYK